MSEAIDGKVMFHGAYFDHDTAVGLAVRFTNGTRHAVRMSSEATPAEIAEALRALANWCDAQTTKMPEDTRS